jgi:hypothetical protein
MFLYRDFSNCDVNMLVTASQLRRVQPLHQFITKILYISDDMGLYPEHEGQNTAMKIPVALF